MDNHICLSELLDQDLSSYEFFYSLSDEVRQRIAEEDPTSFEEMQRIAAEEKHLV